ncbi:RNA polymerase subunit sigma-70 [Vibrio cholerae]|nr:RNA polymerase subunit sigma-70 [Vibrio cholerae]
MQFEFCNLSIPWLLEAAAVLATFVPPQSHSLSMLMGMNSLAAYLQLQVVWG